MPEQRIDAQGVPAEHMNPVHSFETVGQLLRSLDVAQAHERIVELHVLQVVTVKLPSQPLVAVDVDLNLARGPTLELDVDEPQISNTCASPTARRVSDRSETWENVRGRTLRWVAGQGTLPRESPNSVYVIRAAPRRSEEHTIPKPRRPVRRT